MIRFVVLLLALCAAAAQAEGIGEVLDRSQQRRLSGFSVADPQAPATTRVRESFEALVRATGLEQPVALQVVTGDVLAETLQGRVIVANQSLGDLPETGRLFILAHEIGHVSLDHWPKMTLLYQSWLPGELVQARAEAVASLLGRDASALAHRQEFEADAFAMRTLHAMGRSPAEIVDTVRGMGVFSETATHPGTHRRLAALLEAASSAETASGPDQAR
jgi:Zn-dependent protease with chaperone function